MQRPQNQNNDILRSHLPFDRDDSEFTDEDELHVARGIEDSETEVVSDVRLKEEVIEALTFDPDLDAADIEIEVKEGVAFLRGFVRTPDERTAAVESLESVDGLVAIHDELLIGRAN